MGGSGLTPDPQRAAASGPSPWGAANSAASRLPGSRPPCCGNGATAPRNAMPAARGRTAAGNAALSPLMMAMSWSLISYQKLRVREKTASFTSPVEGGKRNVQCSRVWPAEMGSTGRSPSQSARGGVAGSKQANSSEPQVSTAPATRHSQPGRSHHGPPHRSGVSTRAIRRGHSPSGGRGSEWRQPCRSLRRPVPCRDAGRS